MEHMSKMQIFITHDSGMLFVLSVIDLTLFCECQAFRKDHKFPTIVLLCEDPILSFFQDALRIQRTHFQVRGGRTMHRVTLFRRKNNHILDTGLQNNFNS